MPEVDPLVEALLEGQLDAQPDRHPAGLAGALVPGLHDPRPAAGDHRVAGAGEPGSDLLGEGVVRVGGVGAGGPEDAHGRSDVGQRPEALDELGLDAQHPPGIGVHPFPGVQGVEQSLVGRGRLDLAAAQQHRALVLGHCGGYWLGRDVHPGSSTHGSCSMISVVMPRTVGALGSPAGGRAESCRPTLGEVPATYESVGLALGARAGPVEGVCENGVPVTSWMTRRATATAWSAYRS